MAMSARAKAAVGVLLIVVFVVGIGIGYYLPRPAPPVVKPVKVGVIYPLTGALAKPGRDARTCITMAVEEANLKGGIKSLGGARIDVVWADNRGDPKVGAAEAERLITEEGVCMLVGSYSSSCTATASEVAERYGIPFLNPESTSFRLVERDLEWFFRTTPDDAFFAISFFDLMDELKAEHPDIPMKRIAIVFENTLWGADCGEVQKKYAEEYGYEVVEFIPYEHKTIDLHPEAAKLAAAAPDAILITSYLSDAILWTKTWRELDFNCNLILSMDVGFVDPGYFEAVGTDGDYIINRELFCADLVEKKPAIAEAETLFFERTGEHLTGTPARAYTAALLMIDVLERAGATDPESIRTALRETDWPAEKVPLTWDGIKFDERGQNILGKGILVQTFDAKPYTVWPTEWATRELVFPMPTWAERP